MSSDTSFSSDSDIGDHEERNRQSSHLFTSILVFSY